MVTLEYALLYPFMITTPLAAVASVILFLIIRSRCEEKNILTLVANKSFGAILIVIALVGVLYSKIHLFALGLALLCVLSFAIVWGLRKARAWVRYLAMGISLVLILSLSLLLSGLFFYFINIVVIQTFVLMVILLVVSTLILFVSMRLIYTKIEFLPGLTKLGIGYICISVVLASIVAFFISCSLLEAIGRIDISHTLKNLDKSDRLLITTCWDYTEKIEITDRETIHRVHDIIEQAKYKMGYTYGALAIGNYIDVKMYSGGREIGEFGIVGHYAFFNSRVFNYPSSIYLLVHLRKAVGATNS